MPALTRAIIISRSNSPTRPAVWNMARPLGVVVSGLAFDVEPQPVSRIVCSTSIRCCSDRPRRSEDQTASISNSRRTAALSMASNPAPLVTALGAADPRSSNTFFTTLWPQCSAHACSSRFWFSTCLVVRAHAHVECDPFGFGHGYAPGFKSEHTITYTFLIPPMRPFFARETWAELL